MVRRKVTISELQLNRPQQRQTNHFYIDLHIFPLHQRRFSQKTPID